MIADKLAALLPFSGKARPGPTDDFWYRPVGGVASSGVEVTVDTAMQTATVFACIRLLSETIGSLPCILYERMGDGESRKRARDHWLYKILHDRPNGWQTPQEFFEMGTAHLNLRGNFYCYRLSGRNGPVEELLPLNPDRMSVSEDENRVIRYEYDDPLAGKQVYTQDEIFHVRGFGTNGLTGISPLEYARNTVGLSIAQQEHGAKLFANGSIPPYYIKRPEGKGRFTPEAIKNFRESWRGMHAGAQNAHNPPILEDGMTLEALGVDNKDSQWLESQGFQAVEICKFFRVPPHMVGILDRATFSNIEHQGAEFLMYTLGPWLVRFSQAIRRDLIDVEEKENEQYFAEFLADALLRGDTKSRYEAYNLALGGAPFMTENEVRSRENLNPMEGGNEMQRPLNMTQGEDENDDEDTGGETEPEPDPLSTDNAEKAKPEVTNATPAAPPLDITPIIADAAKRIAKHEHALLTQRIDKIKEDPDRWREWALSMTAKHEERIRGILSPLIQSIADNTHEEWDQKGEPIAMELSRQYTERVYNLSDLSGTKFELRPVDILSREDSITAFLQKDLSCTKILSNP